MSFIGPREESSTVYDAFPPDVAEPVIRALPPAHRVDALRGLAGADITPTGRAIAQTGYADFLARLQAEQQVCEDEHQYHRRRLLKLAARIQGLADLARRTPASNISVLDWERWNKLCEYEGFRVTHSSNMIWTRYEAERYALHDMWSDLVRWEHGDMVDTDMLEISRSVRQSRLDDTAWRGQNAAHNRLLTYEVRLDAADLADRFVAAVQTPQTWAAFKAANPDYASLLFYVHRYGDPCQIFTGRGW